MLPFVGVVKEYCGLYAGGEIQYRFGSYKNRNGCNGRLESDLRGVSQAILDLGVFQ